MSSPVLRCKVYVSQVNRSIRADGAVESETVQMHAVYSGSDENKEWSKYTPSANFSITITNPKAHGVLSRDHEFYIGFTPANG